MQPLEAEDPRTVGAYRLLGRIGAGGMGRVYLGRSAGGRTVAVKVVHPQFAADDQFRERFRREVGSARRVGGDWTAPVLDAGPEAAVPWVATGYVAGPSVQQAVVEHGPLPETSVRALGAGLAEALRHVHGLGLVHRDVKPSNVLLTLDGPRLIDFGIVRAADGTASLTSSGVSIGSPGYMSPEQVLGKGAGAASDVFSLGAVLAYAATGEPPFPGDSSAALLYMVVHEEPELGALTGELRETVAACLAKEAAHRPAPAEIARTLAGPAGAAGLVRPGWLPAPTVEQVSRRAVELLNLEPEAPVLPASPGETASGPVPFTQQSEAPPTATGHPATPPAPAQAPSVAHPPTAQDVGPPSTGRPLSPGLSVRSEVKRERRGLSCTLAVSVAGALVAVTFGAYALNLLPGLGDDGQGDSAAEEPAASHSASGRPTPGEPPRGGSEGEVPKGFLGTWQGELVSDSSQPVGTMRITIKQGALGDRVATSTVSLLGQECPGRWTLADAAEKKLTLDGKLTRQSVLCTDNGAPDDFTLRGENTLGFQSRDPKGGNATGTLHRVK